MIGLINGIDVPIGVGSLTSCVRTRIARRSKYEANMPVEITATMEIMLMLSVETMLMDSKVAAAGVVLKKD